MNEAQAVTVIYGVLKDRRPHIPRLVRQEMAEAIARELASMLENNDGDYD